MATKDESIQEQEEIKAKAETSEKEHITDVG
jgi:hypothetical protein